MRPICHYCNKPVDRFVKEEDYCNQRVYLMAFCHGEMQKMFLTREEIERYPQGTLIDMIERRLFFNGSQKPNKIVTAPVIEKKKEWSLSDNVLKELENFIDDKISEYGQLNQ